ncbi:hypothetical protein ABLE92_22065 [Gordonia sp. VNQ95]|uniref:hypothetical protein n=1 Tax=Gordonia sp. VNQ95 TaxID=3156619 RepID=UPI0032B5F3DE
MPDDSTADRTRFDDLLAAHAQWVKVTIPEFDADRTDQVTRLLRIAFRAAATAHPGFDPTAWTHADADLLVELERAMQVESLATTEFGGELGVGLHTMLVFLGDHEQWTGTTESMAYAREALDRTITDRLPEVIEEERRVYLAVEPMRSLLELLRWIGKGRDTDPQGRFAVEREDLDAHLPMPDSLTGELWRFALRRDLISTGGGKVHRGAAASTWRGDRPPIGDIREAMADWIAYRLDSNSAALFPKEEEQLRDLVHQALGPNPPDVAHFESRLEEFDPDELPEDDPDFYADPNRVRAALDEFVAEGWIRFEGGKWFVPEEFYIRVRAGLKELDHMQYRRREERRERKRRGRGRGRRW